MIKGQCHCGAVRYESPGPIIKSSYCDCRGCQRTTGTLKAPFVTVPSGSFQVVAGQAASFRAQSGDRCDAHGVWHYCRACGSPVYWERGGDQVDIFAGTLDDTALFAPEGSRQ